MFFFFFSTHQLVDWSMRAPLRSQALFQYFDPKKRGEISYSTLRHGLIGGTFGGAESGLSFLVRRSQGCRG